MDLEKHLISQGNMKQILVPLTKCKVGLPLNAILDLFFLLSLRIDKLVSTLLKVLNSYCSNWENFREIEFITIDSHAFYGIINFYHYDNRQWAVQKEQLSTNLLPVTLVPSVVPVMHRAFIKFLLILMKISNNRKEEGRERKLATQRILLNSLWITPIEQRNCLIRCILSPTFMVRNMILEPYPGPLNLNPQKQCLEIYAYNCHSWWFLCFFFFFLDTGEQ